jgi:hypothetical protein
VFKGLVRRPDWQPRLSTGLANTSLTLSTTDRAASESRAGDPATTRPAAFATAITRLAARATSTVTLVELSLPPPLPFCGACSAAPCSTPDPVRTSGPVPSSCRFTTPH